MYSATWTTTRTFIVIKILKIEFYGVFQFIFPLTTQILQVYSPFNFKNTIHVHFCSINRVTTTPMVFLIKAGTFYEEIKRKKSLFFDILKTSRPFNF